MDRAVLAARKAFDEGPWRRMSGYERGRMLMKLADLIDANSAEIAALETIDNGMPLMMTTHFEVAWSTKIFRYYAGWADKI